MYVNYVDYVNNVSVLFYVLMYVVHVHYMCLNILLVLSEVREKDKASMQMAIAPASMAR